MHYIKIKTEHNTIELVVDNYFDKDVQEIINQPYVEEVYLRCVDYEKDYKNTKKLVKEKK